MSVRILTNLRLSLFRGAFYLLILVPLFLFSMASRTYAENLWVITNSVNDNGGIWNPSDFGITVTRNGTVTPGSSIAGKSEPGNLFIFPPGDYRVSVGVNSLYEQSIGGDCDSEGNVTLSGGNDKTCIVTNNDIPARLRVIKTVINDFGGTLTAADFTIHVRIGGADVLGSPAPGQVTPGNIYELRPGTYLVDEDLNGQYQQSIGGDCDPNGNVTLSIGEQKTCLITNTFITPSGSNVPGFPETGNTSNGIVSFVVEMMRNFPWIVLGVVLGVAGTYYRVGASFQKGYKSYLSEAKRLIQCLKR